MKRNIIIWGTAIILTVIAWYVVKHQGNGINLLGTVPSASPQASWSNTTFFRQKASGFTLPDLSDKNVSLEDFKGKYVYLNFWATWCPSCRAELPGVEKLYQQYKDKNLVVLTVDLGEDKETVQNFMSQNKYDFPVLLDSDKNVGADYGITAIPVSYFIGPDGNVVLRRVGALSEEELLSDINQLVLTK